MSTTLAETLLPTATETTSSALDEREREPGRRPGALGHPDTLAMSPQTTSTVTTSVHRGGPAALEEVADAWRALCDDVATEPCLRPEWFRAHLVTREPEAEVVLVLAWRGAELRAVLPLLRESTRFHGVPVRRLRAIGAAEVAERFDLVHDPAERAEVVSAVWRALRELRGWDLLDVHDVPSDGALLELLRLAAADGCRTKTRASTQSPYIPLPGPGGSLDEALAGTTAKFRANVRRRRRNLEKTGEVRLVRTERYTPVVFDQFLALEASGWKGEQGTAIAADPATTAYYRALAQAASDAGYLSMYALLCEDEPVAAHFGLMLNGRYAVPKLAYDETRHQFAPGHLLVHAVLEDLVARGAREFDFLGVNMPWKAEWTPLVRSHERCFVFRPTPRGRLAHLVRFRLLTVARRAQRRATLLLATCREVASRPRRLHAGADTAGGAP